MGTLEADNIEVKIDERPLSASEVIPSQQIAYLPQDPFLPKEMKVRDVIPLFYEKADDQDKIFYAEGVGAFDSKKVGKLSSGQRKYLELLLVAHLQHPFLLLDEPFSIVEPFEIEKIKNLLFSLKSEKGIVVTDHYYADVLEIAGRSFLIKNGKKLPVQGEQDLRNHGYLVNSRK